MTGDTVELQALVAAPDGSERLFAVARESNPEQLVIRVHAELVRQGANAYIEPRRNL